MLKSELNCKSADLCLCLGTTLQILPVGGYPFLSKKNGGKIVIVNLQDTRLNSKADLIINNKLDLVFQILIEKFLCQEIPSIERIMNKNIEIILDRGEDTKDKENKKFLVDVSSVVVS